MSHLIKKPYDVVYCPELGEYKDTWHNEHDNVQGAIAVDGSNVQRVFRPIREAGFKIDFESPITNLPGLQKEAGESPVNTYKVILADLRDDGNGVLPLHVAKKTYTIHQNKDLFQAFIGACEQVLGKGEFEIATIGTLGGYSQFFVSIAIKGNDTFTIGKSDVHRKFFNLVSSHNGLVSSAMMLSIVRIVCMNTVQASIGDSEVSGTKSTIKHTVNSEKLITAELFGASLQAWIKESVRMETTLATFIEREMTVENFRSFATGVFTTPETDKLATTSFNRINDMVPMFQRGVNGSNRGETVYDGYQAFTEYFTSGNGVGSKDVAASKRIASANFGRGNDWKLQAFEFAADETIYEDCLERGSRLYSEKLAEVASQN